MAWRHLPNALVATLLALAGPAFADVRSLRPPAAVTVTRAPPPKAPRPEPPPPTRERAIARPTTLHAMPPPPAARFATIVDAVKTGGIPRDLAPVELRAVQGHALETVLATFRDEQGDAALLGAARRKASFYANATLGLDARGVEARPLVARQADALKVIVHTFRDAGEEDTALRSAALEKLGALGAATDAVDLMALVRKPPHSADLHNALEAVRSILQRAGSPIPRGDAHLALETRMLLGKAKLAGEERRTVVKDVLEHGEIVGIVKNESPTSNAVYFLRFKETVPDETGKRVPIEGVWKPEGTFVGKQKPTFNREVSAYEFTRKFSKVDIVPVTVEGALAPDQIPGEQKPFGVGSIQYRVPGGESIGRGYPDSRLLKPAFEAFLRTPEAQKQMAEIRTHLFILNDPEKLPNAGGYDVHNWGNILAAPDPAKRGSYKLYIIDNGTGQGALTQFGTAIQPDILPGGATRTAKNLRVVRGTAIEAELETEIGEADAADIRRRVERVVAPPGN